MSTNLIQIIKDQLNSETVSQLAVKLGESESGISKAISAFLPAVIGGFVNNNTPSELLNTLKESPANFSLLSNITSNESQDSPYLSKILTLIFGNGDKLEAITSSVSEYAGINKDSTASVLKVVTATVSGVIGKYTADKNVDSLAFGNLLNEQKSSLSLLLPAGFSFASLGLGNWFGNVDAAPTNVIPEVNQVPEEEINPTVPLTEGTIKTETPKIDVTRSGTTHEIVSERESGGNIWKWLLPLLLLLLLGWFFWKQCNKKAEVLPVTTTDSTVTEVDSSNTKGDTVTVTRETTVVTLPSGKTLQAYKGGIEDQIVMFLKSDDYKNATETQLKDRWFNFDNLNFEFGKAILTPESQTQLNNLKIILAEFPDAKIKIGAYTDKKGDANTNLKLSNDRANTVKSALNSNQVVEAEGYGSKFAKVPAEATDKERESDRKTAVRLIK